MTNRMRKVLFSKFANDRNDYFKIITTIYEFENIKKVEKRNLHYLGKQHIQNIYDNYNLLEHLINDDEINVTKAQLNNNGIEFEYIEGELLTDKLNKLIFESNYKEFLHEIENYKQMILYNQTISSFQITDEFIKVFGEISLNNNFKAVKINNIDFIFDNIIINEKINIIDYEWVVDFQVPLNYVLYRAIKYFLIQLNKLNFKLDIDLWNYIEINDAEKEIFEQMECNFYNYVNKDYVNLYDLNKIWNFNQIQYPVLKLINENDKLLNQKNYQVFYDYGTGFSETNSYKKLYEINDLGDIVIRIPLCKEIKELRFDPSFENCMIHLDYMHILSQGYTKEANYVSNANWDSSNLMIFITNDPQIVFKNIDYENSLYIEIKFRIDYLSSGDLHKLKKVLVYSEEVKETLDKKTQEYQDEKEFLQGIIKQQLNENKMIVELYEKELKEKKIIINKIEEYEKTWYKISSYRLWKLIKKIKNQIYRNR